MCRHFEIRPVERDCVCLERGRDGSHIAVCNAAFREKFFGAWHDVRVAFNGAEAERRRHDAIAARALLN